MEDLKNQIQSNHPLEEFRKQVMGNNAVSIDGMFDRYCLVNKIDPRKTPPHEMKKVRHAFVAGIAQCIVVVSMFNAGPEMVQSLLDECEKFLLNLRCYEQI